MSKQKKEDLVISEKRFHVSNKNKRRKIEFVSPDKTLTSCKPRPIDWGSCFICQRATGEKLQSSMKSTSAEPRELYHQLAERLIQYRNADMMPLEVEFSSLEDGGNLGESLYKHGAVHHKSCKLLFSSSKLDTSQTLTPKILTEKTTTRSSKEGTSSPKMDEQLCFFCNMPSDEKNSLHLVLSFRLDQRVRRCASILKDNLLQAKLENGDMIAQDAMYHKTCILDLYRKANTTQLQGNYTDSERRLHRIALSDLVAYIQESIISAEETIPIFVLSDLTKRYCDKLTELGVEITGRYHSTRLKHRILSQFEDLVEYHDGRQVLLAFRGDIGATLTTAASIDYDDEGYILAEAARIIRKDIITHKYDPFVGKFEKDCQNLFKLYLQ